MPENKVGCWLIYGSRTLIGRHLLLLRPESLASATGHTETQTTALHSYHFIFLKVFSSSISGLSLSFSLLQVCLGVAVFPSNLLRHLETSGSLFMKSVCNLHL